MEMTPRERFLATAAFEPLDRPFRMETIGFWPETLARWNGEGLPEDIGDEMGAFLHFGIDLQLPVLLGAHEHPGFDPLFEEIIIEQDERYIVKIDKSGAEGEGARRRRQHYPCFPGSAREGRGELGRDQVASGP